MTCIVGLEHGGRVYLGGDSACTDPNGYVAPLVEAKVFRFGPLLIGFCGTLRFGQLVKHTLLLPQQENKSDIEYMVTDVATAVGVCLQAADNLSHEDDGKATTGGCLLIGYHGKLYEMDQGLGVQATSRPYNAIGSGAYIALGALHALLRHAEMAPRSCVLAALKAAADHHGGVRAPFTILMG